MRILLLDTSNHLGIFTMNFTLGRGFEDTASQDAKMPTSSDEADRWPSPNRFDSNGYRLPFASRLLEDALDYPPDGAPEPSDELTTRETLDWLGSPSVKPTLQQWKQTVVADEKLRAKIQPDMSVDFETSSNIIKTLTSLCSQTTSQPATDDALKLTAQTAATLVHANDHPGSPFLGLVKAGQAHWRYGVAVRLLITVFCDLTAHDSGYFMTLLGGPAPQPITDERLLTDTIRTDNWPVVVDSEKDGRFGFKYLSVDYSWLEVDAEQKAREQQQPNPREYLL